MIGIRLELRHRALQAGWVFGQSRAAQGGSHSKSSSISPAMGACDLPDRFALSGWRGGTKAGSRARIRSIRAAYGKPDAGRIGAGRRVSLGRWPAGTAPQRGLCPVAARRSDFGEAADRGSFGPFFHARRSDSSLGGDGFHSGSFPGSGARGGSGLRPPCRVLQAGSCAIENGRAHGRRFQGPLPFEEKENHHHHSRHRLRGASPFSRRRSRL